METVDTDLLVPEDAPPVEIVEARWVGHFEAQLPDGRILVPGETVVEIPEPEAIASDNWEIVADDDGKVTKEDLVAEAKDLDIKVPSRATKADIEELIAARRQELADEETAAAAAAAADGEPSDEHGDGDPAAGEETED